MRQTNAESLPELCDDMQASVKSTTRQVLCSFRVQVVLSTDSCEQGSPVSVSGHTCPTELRLSKPDCQSASVFERSLFSDPEHARLLEAARLRDHRRAWLGRLTAIASVALLCIAVALILYFCPSGNSSFQSRSRRGGPTAVCPPCCMQTLDTATICTSKPLHLL